MDTVWLGKKCLLCLALLSVGSLFTMDPRPKQWNQQKIDQRAREQIKTASPAERIWIDSRASCYFKTEADRHNKKIRYQNKGKK